jgi:hypothetical protein
VEIRALTVQSLPQQLNKSKLAPLRSKPQRKA